LYNPRAVQNNSLIIIQDYLAHSAICLPHHPLQRPGFNPTPVHVRYVVDKLAQGQVVLPVLHFPPRIILPVLHTYLHLLAALAKTNGCSLTTFDTAMLFYKSGSTGQNRTFR